MKRSTIYEQQDVRCCAYDIFSENNKMFGVVHMILSENNEMFAVMHMIYQM